MSAVTADQGFNIVRSVEELSLDGLMDLKSSCPTSLWMRRMMKRMKIERGGEADVLSKIVLFMRYLPQDWVNYL